MTHLEQVSIIMDLTRLRNAWPWDYSQPKSTSTPSLQINQFVALVSIQTFS